MFGKQVKKETSNKLDASKKVLEMHASNKQTGLFKGDKLRGKGVNSQWGHDLKDRTDQPLLGEMNQEYAPFWAQLGSNVNKKKYSTENYHDRNAFDAVRLKFNDELSNITEDLV